MVPEIIFEDEYLLIAVKPCGLLSQGQSARTALSQGCASTRENVTVNSETTFPELLSRYRREKDENDSVFTVHRLDRGTDGLILYAKTKDAAARLGELVKHGKIRKTYLALCEGVPETPKGEMTDLLYFDRQKNKSFTVKKERKGVKKARLTYRLRSIRLVEGYEASLVEVRLFTGRTHQIRVQFAARKMPLIGDRRYGSHVKAPRIFLTSHELLFTHPYTGEKVRAVYTPDYAKEPSSR